MTTEQKLAVLPLTKERLAELLERTAAVELETLTTVVDSIVHASPLLDAMAHGTTSPCFALCRLMAAAFEAGREFGIEQAIAQIHPDVLPDPPAGTAPGSDSGRVC